MRDGWQRGVLADFVLVNPTEQPLSEDALFVPMDAVAVGQRWITYTEERGSRGGCRFQAGDTLFARITPCLENGKVAQVQPEIPRGGGSTEFVVLRAKAGLLPALLYHWATMPSTRDAAAALMVGTSGRKRVSGKDIGQLPIDIPPLDEQRRIVELIDAVDITTRGALAVMAASDSAARSLTLRDQATWLESDQVELGEIAEIVGGVTKDKKKQAAPDLVEVPYLRVANVQRGYLDLTEVTSIRVEQKVLDRLRLKPGDVLLNEGGDRDKLGRGSVWEGQVGDCIHQNHVFRARLTDDSFSPYFVSLWANSFGQQWFYENGGQTTGIASISMSTLKRFPVPRVPRAVQETLLAVTHASTTLARSAEHQAMRLRMLRSSLLDDLLSGEHEIPESYDEFLEAV